MVKAPSPAQVAPAAAQPLDIAQDPPPGRGAPPLVTEALTTVNYAYGEFKGDKRLIEALGAAIMSEYEIAGATGQWTNFPLFTHRYLSQSTRSHVPPDILKWIQTCAQAYLEREAPHLNINVRPETIYPLWANVHRAGEYHSAHNHGMGEYVLSGVIFVRAPSDLKQDSEGLLILERTALPSVEGRFDMVYRPGEKLPIRPMPGWIVLFPPFVRHYVTPHLSTQPRISVAFNILNSAVVGLK